MVALHDFEPKHDKGEAQVLAPITEPIVINSVFITGGVIEVTDTCLRLVCWEQTIGLCGESAERRIVMRIAMSTTTARDIAAGLRKTLAKGGH